MKYNIRITALLLSLLLLCSLCMAAYAHEVPDESRKGSITVEMVYDGSAVTGGTLAAYRVGQVQEDDGNYSFGKTPDMADLAKDYTNLDDPELADAVAEFVAGKQLSAYKTAKNEDGKAVFSDLELGLYLIVQTEASAGFEAIKPFLVAVPINEDGHYIYEVNAEGKLQLHQEPAPTASTTPTQPQKPNLPQTGQLNWPIPVLAVLGLALFSLGWVLHLGKKKEQ